MTGRFQLGIKIQAGAVAGQPVIQEDQFDPALGQFLHTLFGSACADDGIARAFEPPLLEPGHAGVVLDDKDPAAFCIHHGRLPRG